MREASAMKSSIQMLAMAAVAAAVAGCVGAASEPLQLSNAAPSTRVPDTCPSDHGVSLSPCKVILDGSEPEVKVTAKGPKGGTFSYNDKTCIKKTVATISGSGTKYTVAAGENVGTCTAVFTDQSDGKTIGTAKLYIINDL